MKRLQFVLGKGGVGKSTVACAMALSLSKRGKRVLLVQVHAQDSHSALLGIAPIQAFIADSGPMLSTINLQPQACLKEYLNLRAPVPVLADLLFRPSILATVVDFLPGLAELVMMGKITFHLEEMDSSGKPRFDCIIVDLPATGHGIKMLNIAKSTNNLVKKGRLGDETEHMQSLISDQEQTCVHLVTLLDELPVQETLAAVTQIENAGLVGIGGLLVNRIQNTGFQELSFPNDRPEIQDIWVLWREESEKERYWLDILSTKLPNVLQSRLPEILNYDFGPNEIKVLADQILC